MDSGQENHFLSDTSCPEAGSHHLRLMIQFRFIWLESCSNNWGSLRGLTSPIFISKQQKVDTYMSSKIVEATLDNIANGSHSAYWSKGGEQCNLESQDLKEQRQRSFVRTVCQI